MNGSPPRPKPEPGLTATLASLASLIAKSSDDSSLYGSGIGAQTNMVPFGFSISQPTRASPSQSTSRRCW